MLRHLPIENFFFESSHALICAPQVKLLSLGRQELHLPDLNCDVVKFHNPVVEKRTPKFRPPS
jgi:hypothetical protein